MITGTAGHGGSHRRSIAHHQLREDLLPAGTEEALLRAPRLVRMSVATTVRLARWRLAFGMCVMPVFPGRPRRARAETL